MGFLDQSTNNIIIDAVLTDAGRELLANNQGNFKIAFFSLADDEVDYSIIEKYGRAVGKEKIAKNTPVFEAQTLGSIAEKHRLITLPNPKVVRLPSYSLIAGAEADGVVTFQNNAAAGQKTKTIQVEQVVAGITSVPEGVADSTFSLQVPDRFVSVGAQVPISLEPSTRVAYYALESTTTTETNGSSVTFTLSSRTLDDTAFTIYGDAHNKNQISGVVSLIGDQSGLRKDFKFTITK
jgi:hypothetical protein